MGRYDSSDIWLCGIIAFIVGIMLGAIMVETTNDDARKLGGAVCEKEYHQDFDKYYDGILYCKSKDATIKYDGLPVVIEKSIK